MHKPAEIIGIGAINYDYMFQCARDPSSLTKTNRESKPSSEELNWSLKKTEETIQQFYDSPFTICSTQIGGSALLALRAIKAVCPSMSFGYVGVCGEYNDFDQTHKQELKDLSEELAFIDHQEWLFRTTDRNDCPEKYIGKSSCTIYKGSRNGIGIFPGANNLLQTFIEEKCKSESLADYLAQARWIHISSLSDLNMWTAIMEHVLQAKKKNSSLKISIDPGNEFTKMHKDRIQKYLQAADYLFLNPTEKEHLGRCDCSEYEKTKDLQYEESKDSGKLKLDVNIDPKEVPFIENGSAKNSPHSEEKIPKPSQPVEKDQLESPQSVEIDRLDAPNLSEKNRPCNLQTKDKTPQDQRIDNEEEILRNIRNYLGNKPVQLVFKYKDRHVLVDGRTGTSYTHHHLVIPQDQLVNDTGAGDFFAGGFIGGLLSDEFPDDPSCASAIETGNILSSSRIVTDSIQDALALAMNRLKK